MLHWRLSPIAWFWFLCAALGQSGAPVRSPELASDGRITFRFPAPNARRVEVDAQLSRFEMQPGESGVWTVTTPPMPPDVYEYWFVVDGIAVPDPGNPIIGGNNWFTLPLSIVEVPGPRLSVSEQRNIPHGQIHHHVYDSGILKEESEFFVYTPPGYDSRLSARYPVLYLLHGNNNTASTWFDRGAANFVLDNLISSGKAPPMLIVCPSGWASEELRRRSPEVRANGTNFGANIEAFERVLLAEVIPTVERSYRTQTDRRFRALAGVSMGSGMALAIGLRHIGEFSSVGAFSGALSLAATPEISFADRARLRLLWLSVGTDERALDSARDLKQRMQALGIRVVASEQPGFHTWGLFRRNLSDFAQVVFDSPTRVNKWP